MASGSVHLRPYRHESAILHIGPEILPIDMDWGIEAMRLDAAVSRGLLGKGVKVAVVDTGVDYTHPYLKDAVKGHVCFVPGETDEPGQIHEHATHVAGTIHRFAPEAEIYSVKVLSRTGSGDDAWVTAGIEWCVENHMDIINMSLGGPDDYPPMHDAIKRFVQQGGTVVVAAGNDGPPKDPNNPDDVDYPGRYDECLCITAVDQNLQHADFASQGPEVDVAAPGVGIWSCLPGNAWGALSGTSMATPHAAAAIAVLKAAGIQDPATAAMKFVQPLQPIPMYGHGFFRFDLVPWEQKPLPAATPPAQLQPVLFGVDTATRLTAAQAQALKAAGVDVVIRYAAPLSRGFPKTLLADEAKAISQAGLNLATVYEVGANPIANTGDAASAYYQGQDDAQQALAWAQAVDQPRGTTIFFALDYDVPKSDYDRVRAYFEGIVATLGGAYRTGVYAKADVVDFLVQNKLVDDAWQCMAWSHGRLSPNACMYQFKNGQVLAGVSVDFNRIFGLGPWLWRIGGVVAPTPGRKPNPNPVTPPQGGSDVPTLKQGDSGDAVRVLQRMLVSLGYDTGGVDGVFGPKTLAAVRAFQQAAKLAVDGVAGPKTWEALATTQVPVKTVPDPNLQKQLQALQQKIAQAKAHAQQVVADLA